MEYSNYDQIYLSACKEMFENSGEDTSVIVLSPVLASLTKFHNYLWKQFSESMPPLFFIEDYNDINTETGKDYVHVLVFSTKEEAEAIAKTMNVLSKSTVYIPMAKLASEFTKNDEENIKQGKWCTF